MVKDINYIEPNKLYLLEEIKSYKKNSKEKDSKKNSKEKDSKSLSNVITPVVKKTWENPIDSQNIFHQTQVEIDDQMTKVKIDSYLTSLLERGNNTNHLQDTIDSLQAFM
jgi:hypothetical protein